jgi:tetratricopeptide (TPR) repeat protein
VLLYDLRDFPRALIAAKRYWEALPAEHQAQQLYARALVLASKENAEEALTRADEAIKNLPTCRTCVETRGLALFDLKRYADALKDYDRLIKAKPDETAYLSTRASILAGLKRYKEAVASLEKAISIDASLAEKHAKSLKDWAEKAEQEK